MIDDLWPVVQDLLLSELYKEYIGAILFLNADSCRNLMGENPENKEVNLHVKVHQYLDEVFGKHDALSTDSSINLKDQK